MRTCAHRRLAVVFTSIAAMAGCEVAAFSDPMVGCFALKDGGAPEVRISKVGEAYALALRNGRSWTDSMALRRANQHELGELFKSDTAGIAEGLVSVAGGFGVFRARHATNFNGNASSSDYFAFLLVGGGPAFRVKCE